MPIQQEPILSSILLLLFVMLCFIYNVLRHTAQSFKFYSFIRAVIRKFYSVMNCL